MDRSRIERVAGRLLLGFVGAMAAGFTVAISGWQLHDGFSGSCTLPGPNAGLGEMYYAAYTALDLLTLGAAATIGILFLRTERRLGRRHEIATSLGLVAFFGLAALQLWYAVLTSFAVHPLCW